MRGGGYPGTTILVLWKCEAPWGVLLGRPQRIEDSYLASCTSRRPSCGITGIGEVGGGNLPGRSGRARPGPPRIAGVRGQGLTARPACSCNSGSIFVQWFAVHSAGVVPGSEVPYGTTDIDRPGPGTGGSASVGSPCSMGHLVALYPGRLRSCQCAREALQGQGRCSGLLLRWGLRVEVVLVHTL